MVPFLIFPNSKKLRHVKLMILPTSVGNLRLSIVSEGTLELEVLWYWTNVLQNW